MVQINRPIVNQLASGVIGIIWEIIGLGLFGVKSLIWRA